MAKRRQVGRWTAEHAREVIEAWRQSGQSGTAYARTIGVVPQRLYWWRDRLAGGPQQTPMDAGRAALVPVVVRGGGSEMRVPRVVVATSAGLRIEVNDIDANTAAWVLTLLSEGDAP